MFLIKYVLLANSRCWRKADEYEKQIYPGSLKGYLLFSLIYLNFHRLLTTILLFPRYGKVTLNVVTCISFCVQKPPLYHFFPVCHFSYYEIENGTSLSQHISEIVLHFCTQE